MLVCVSAHSQYIQKRRAFIALDSVSSPVYRIGNDTLLSASAVRAEISDSVAGGGTPGGADTYVQYNKAGVLDGTAGLVYDYTNTQLKIYSLKFNRDNTGIINFSSAASSGDGNQLQVQAQHGQTGGTNINGGSLRLLGGNPTGSGISQIIFSTFGGGASGTTTRSVTQKATLYGDGYFGIGLTTPTDYLHIRSGTATVGQIHLNKSAVACNDSGTIQRTAKELHFTDDTAKIQDFVMAAYGELQYYDSKTLAQSASYKRITGLTTGLYKYTTLTDSSIVIISGGDGVYEIKYNIDSKVTNTSTGVEYIIYVNSSAVAKSYSFSESQSATTETKSNNKTFLHALNTNDVVSIRYQSNGSTGNISLYNVSVIIERIDR